jgi:hypothetical protein
MLFSSAAGEDATSSHATGTASITTSLLPVTSLAALLIVCFLYKNDHRIFKPGEITIRRGLR